MSGLCLFSPFVEVEPLTEEQELDVALLEVVASPGHLRALRVLREGREVHLLLLQVVADAHKVKVGGHVDEGVRHDRVSVLGQHLVHEKLEPDRINNIKWRSKQQ